jgi:hypothetical protein
MAPPKKLSREGVELSKQGGGGVPWGTPHGFKPHTRAHVHTPAHADTQLPPSSQKEPPAAKQGRTQATTNAARLMGLGGDHLASLVVVAMVRNRCSGACPTPRCRTVPPRRGPCSVAHCMHL